VEYQIITTLYILIYFGGSYLVRVTLLGCNQFETWPKQLPFWNKFYFIRVFHLPAGPSGRAVLGVGLRPLACCDRGFESSRGHGCFSALYVLFVVRYRSLRQADHSSRGVLPTVARRCVRPRHLLNEEVIARAGLQSQRK
jgi:hypothetical protein